MNDFFFHIINYKRPCVIPSSFKTGAMPGCTPPNNLQTARLVLEEVKAGRRLDRALRSHPLPDGQLIAKHILVAAYRDLVARGEWPEDPDFLPRIRMKPVRTLSGVTTVTVLTKAYPCPGRCVFCPTEAYMPKSYLADEPGAARAFQNKFDPYNQVQSRLQEYQPSVTPTTRSSCSSWAAPGVLTNAITRNGSSAAALTP